ncbi:MAG: flagellar basal body-associated FliL family protein [Acidobacteria bacterium]|jgi:flagellar FliL protein|nr:flagellar basal body-associated FliL family protein [Acidobacteriota bacterium]
MSLQAQSEDGSGRRIPLLFLAGALLVLAAVGGTTALLLRGGAGRAEAQGVRAGAPASPSLVAFDAFVVNLADPGVERYLRASVRAVVSDPRLARELQRDELMRARARDRILSALSAKTFEEVTRPGARDALRDELRREINRTLPDDGVAEVLFVEFVAQ